MKNRILILIFLRVIAIAQPGGARPPVEIWKVAPGTYTPYVGTSSRDIVSTTSHKFIGVK